MDMAVNDDIIIAQYMGMKVLSPGIIEWADEDGILWAGRASDQLHYRESWDELIPVCVKCGMNIVDITDISKTINDVIQRIRDLEANKAI